MALVQSSGKPSFQLLSSQAPGALSWGLCPGAKLWTRPRPLFSHLGDGPSVFSLSGWCAPRDGVGGILGDTLLVELPAIQASPGFGSSHQAGPLSD